MKTLLFSLISFIVMSSAFAQSFLLESKRLFHAGTRTHLEEDIREKTIPRDIWDKVIFGTTDFDLLEYRKGLYGAESMAGTGLYSTYKILAGIEPWVMVIHIRPECLTDKNLFPAFYDVAPIGSGNDHLFTKWYRQNQEKFRHLEKSCTLLNNNNNWRSWSEGVLYSLNLASQEEQLLSKTCTPVLNQFLFDMKIKVVGDNANPDSWYIRDRSCIETIKGTPDDLFKLFIENKLGSDYLEQNIFGNVGEPGNFTSGNLYIILKVLAETTLLNKENLDSLSTTLRELNYSKQEVFDKRNEVSFASGEDSGYLLSASLRAAQKAVRTNNVKVFQKNLSQLLKPLVKDHGATCHGKLGVPEEYISKCNELGDLYGQKLMNLFH